MQVLVYVLVRLHSRVVVPLLQGHAVPVANTLHLRMLRSIRAHSRHILIRLNLLLEVWSHMRELISAGLARLRIGLSLVLLHWWGAGLGLVGRVVRLSLTLLPVLQVRLSLLIREHRPRLVVNHVVVSVELVVICAQDLAGVLGRSGLLHVCFSTLIEVDNLAQVNGTWGLRNILRFTIFNFLTKQGTNLLGIVGLVNILLFFKLL